MLEPISSLILRIRNTLSRELALLQMRWPVLEDERPDYDHYEAPPPGRSRAGKLYVPGDHYGLWFRPFSPWYTLASVQGPWLELHRFDDVHINQLFSRSSTLRHRIHQDQLQGDLQFCFHEDEQSFSLYTAGEVIIERFPVQSRKRLKGLVKRLRRNGLIPSGANLIHREELCPCTTENRNRV